MIDKLKLDNAHTPQNGAAAVTVKWDILQYIRKNSKYGSVSIDDIMSSSLIQEWRIDITLSFEAVQLAVHMLIEEGSIYGISPFTLGPIQVEHIQLHCPEVEVESEVGGEGSSVSFDLTTIFHVRSDMKPAKILRQLYASWDSEISMMQERVKAGMLKSRSKELFLGEMASFLQPHQPGLIQMLLDLGVKLAVPDVNPAEGAWKFTYSEDQITNVLAFHEIFKKLKVYVDNVKALREEEERVQKAVEEKVGKRWEDTISPQAVTGEWVDDSDPQKALGEIMEGTPISPEKTEVPPVQEEEVDPNAIYCYQTMNLLRDFISKRGSVGFTASSFLSHLNVEQLYNHLDNLDIVTNGEIELPQITQEMREEWHRRELGQPGTYIPSTDIPWSHLTEQKFLEERLFDALSKFWHSLRKYMKPAPTITIREVETPSTPAPVERKLPDEVEDPDRSYERTWLKALTQLEMIRRELNIIPYGHVSIPTVDVPRHLMKCFGGDVHLGHEIGALFIPMGEVKNLITELINAATTSIRTTYKFND